MENVSDRLKKFIKFDSDRKWNGSIREFERQIGWKNAAVNQFTDSPKIEKITELKDFAPELNITWLLTGTGEMIVKDYTDDIFNPLYSELPEPEKPNPKQKALDDLKKIQNGKQKNTNEGREVNEDELVPVKTYEIPIKGIAGLRKHFFADEYIENNFKETVTYVPKSERVPKLLKIQADGNSMPPLISPNDYVLCEPIPQIDWMDYKFKSDKIYCFFHHIRGILFKRATNKPYDQIELSSDNPDKVEYPNETFDIGEFKKISIVKIIEKHV